MTKRDEGLLSPRNVAERYGLDHYQLYHWARWEEKFPQSVKVGARTYWRIAELDAYDAWKAELEAGRVQAEWAKKIWGEPGKSKLELGWRELDE